jgi:ABC-type nitrate/sulfonate/bicarbonate transport system permease component
MRSAVSVGKAILPSPKITCSPVLGVGGSKCVGSGGLAGRLRLMLASKSAMALLSFAIFLTFWHLLSLWNSNPIQLPTPFEVFSALADLADDGELFDNAEISTLRLLISLVVTVSVAVPLGFVMGLSQRAEAYIDPLVELLRPISGIAWIPLGLFIFGIGDTLPIFIMVYTAFFPVLLSTIAGVRRTDPKLILAARTMGLSQAAVIRKVIMPASLPSIMIGLRLGFAGAWTAIVAAELIGAPSGLGFAIEWYRGLLMSPKVFAYIMCIGLVGYVCDQLLQILQHRLTPWIDGGRR